MNRQTQDVHGEKANRNRENHVSGASRRPRDARLAAAVARAARASWFEMLEGRQLLSTTTVQTLPFTLDFGSDKGEILDKDGQGTGLTRVQANTAGNQYQPSLIDLDTTAGVLKITTSGVGSSSGTPNDQLNSLETQFNGTIANGFQINARIKGPLGYLNANYDQGGIYFGPDQDNYIKLAPVYSNGQFLQFRDEIGGAAPTLPLA